MEILPHNSTTCLELTMAMPGFSSGEKEGGAKKELDMNEAGSMVMEEEEDDEISNNVGPARRKKLRLTKEQSHLLEDNFLQNQTLNPKEKEALAVELKLKPRQVEVWFQNRRARSKMKQTEMECEYLKRWLGGLREQNRRLQKEVEELRSKVAPPHCRRLTMSMCPTCQRLTTATTTTTTTTTFAKLPSLHHHP